MNFHQWLYLILSVFAAVSAHRVGIMSLAHVLDVRYQAIASNSKPDILGQIAEILPTLLQNVTITPEVSHAQEDGKQSPSSSQEAPKASDGSQSKG